MNYRTPGRSHAAFIIFFMAIAFLGSSIIAIAQTHIAVAPLKMNMLFIGVDNPVSVAASGSEDSKVTVSITGGGGTVSKMNTGLYNVRVTTATDDCIMNVYVDGKLAGSSRFRVRKVPEPLATVGGFRSGAYVAKDFFQRQNGVAAYIENFPFETKYVITGFTVVLVDDKGNLRSILCQGNTFSDEAKQYFQYPKPGDIVTIEHITVKNESGVEHKLPSLLYNIK